MTYSLKYKNGKFIFDTGFGVVVLSKLDVEQLYDDCAHVLEQLDEEKSQN